MEEHPACNEHSNGLLRVPRRVLYSMSFRDLHSTVSAPTLSPPSASSRRPSSFGVSQTAPMAIPQPCEPPSSVAPPPLPPPPHIPELSSGQDSAWQWANAFEGSPHRKQSHASIKQGSSLLGARHGERQLAEGISRLSSKRSNKSALKSNDTLGSEPQERLPSHTDELRSLPSPSGNNHR